VALQEVAIPMRRREFITMLGGAAAAWPLLRPRTARAQQPMPVIGYLASATPEAFASRLRAFRQGLSERGYVEGRNVAIEYRWAEGRNDRLPALAAELVARRVSVMAAVGGAPASLAAKGSTETIPIVFETGADPVAIGLVRSLNRPQGNITGVSSLNSEIEPKRVELLHQMVPGARNLALLVNPTNPTTPLEGAQAGARTLDLPFHVVEASTEQGIDAAFARLVELQAGALVVIADPFFNSRSKQLADRALAQRMPTIAQPRDFPAAGGLASYGGDVGESHRQAGLYVGRILKGEKPGDLPVQRVTKVELIINLKTAKALDLAIPLPLLTRADEVIE
jgi:putative ABC transport system substrate-binding protein